MTPEEHWKTADAMLSEARDELGRAEQLGIVSRQGVEFDPTAEAIDNLLNTSKIALVHAVLSLRQPPKDHGKCMCENVIGSGSPRTGGTTGTPGAFIDVMLPCPPAPCPEPTETLLGVVPAKTPGEVVKERLADRIVPITMKGSTEAADHIARLLTTSPMSLEPTAKGHEYPGDFLDLDHWKLTLCFDKNGKRGKGLTPLEVTQPKLNGYEAQGYFVLFEDGVGFRATCDGATTSDSGYPRVELREMADTMGDKLASWSNTKGVHELHIKASVLNLPRQKPHVVIAQIHDAKDDVCMVRLEGRKLFVESPYSDDLPLDADYKLGTKFKLTIQATKKGVAVYYVKTGGKLVKRTFKKLGKGWYFKTGMYVQSSTTNKAPFKDDLPNAYGQMVMYDLSVLHTS